MAGVERACSESRRVVSRRRPEIKVPAPTGPTRRTVGGAPLGCHPDSLPRPPCSNPHSPRPPGGPLPPPRRPSLVTSRVPTTAATRARHTRAAAMDDTAAQFPLARMHTKWPAVRLSSRCRWPDRRWRRDRCQGRYPEPARAEPVPCVRRPTHSRLGWPSGPGPARASLLGWT